MNRTRLRSLLVVGAKVCPLSAMHPLQNREDQMLHGMVSSTTDTTDTHSPTYNLLNLFNILLISISRALCHKTFLSIIYKRQKFVIC